MQRVPSTSIGIGFFSVCAAEQKLVRTSCANDSHMFLPIKNTATETARVVLISTVTVLVTQYGTLAWYISGVCNVCHGGWTP